MANVTYLLGAGASAEAIPTYASFSKEFKAFCDRIFNHPTEQISEDHLYAHNALCALIPDLVDELPYHLTPDTLAKQYFHQGSDTLLKLKSLLTLFLLNEQREKFDRRYTAFIAALLQSNPNTCTILPGLNVLSWNYDLQFELAFQKFNRIPMVEIFDTLSVYPFLEPYTTPYSRIEHSFKLVHLNGFAFGDSCLTPHVNKELSKPPIEETYIFYEEMYMNKNDKKLSTSNYLRFAWETQPEKAPIPNSTLDIALKIAQQTDILVIIGYSFPIFNNPVDGLIFSNMLNLNKVYIQNPNKEIFEKANDTYFNEILSAENILHITQKESFFLPKELNKTK